MASTSSSSVLSSLTAPLVQWINLAEELHSLKLDAALNVPQICVMGDQSAGKSSVLEALSGIPFPRGAGLVTRVPTRLVMRKAKSTEKWSAIAYTSLDPSNKYNITDISKLHTVIDDLTTILCANKTFSTENITIELVSPDASDLTVVDLPGIIRTVTNGQSSSVINDVNRLIESFLIDTRTIILAVIPANQDIATVDILERARKVDPYGERTVGVITKVDLIGPGAEEEVLAIINNVRKPLALGYTMLKNRSQRDITENLSTAAAREKEHDYFRNHPVYKNCDSNLYGISKLSQKLTSLLVLRIQQQLAPMKQEVERQLTIVRAELRTLATPFGNLAKNASDRQKLLVSIVQEYVRHLTDCVRGEYRDRLMVRNPELRLYTHVLKSFESFHYLINETSPKFKQKEFIKSLASQIEQLKGREIEGFMSHQAFSMCMSQYVDVWGAPTHSLVVDVKVKSLETTEKLADILIPQFPNLREVLSTVASQELNEASDIVTARLDELLRREKDPFTVNDFLQQWVNKLRFDKFSEVIDAVFDEAATPATNWNGLKDEVFRNIKQWYRSAHCVSTLSNANDMATILEAYWNLAAKRYIDNCCMITDSEFLGKLATRMQDRLFSYLRDDVKLIEFFAQDPVLIKKRENAELLRDRLIQASSVLANIHLATPMGNNNVAPPKPPRVTQSLHEVTITVGADGIGISGTDGPDGKIIVKDFRKMPNNAPNPSQQSGLCIGDIVEKINGVIPSNPTECAQLLKGAKGKVTLTVTRREN